jgi:hypothetical protein
MISIAHIFAPYLSFLARAGSLVESTARKTNKTRPLASSWTAVYLAFCERHKFIDRRPLVQVLRSSIKGEVKKKHVSGGRSFSCFPAHVIERDLF